MRISLLEIGLSFLMVISVLQAVSNGADKMLQKTGPVQSMKPGARPKVLQDQELAKIDQSLQAATANKASAGPLINEILQVVRSALLQLDACPEPKGKDKFSSPPMIAAGNEISMQCAALTCSVYLTCAKSNENYSTELLNKLRTELNSARSMQREMAAKCRGNGVSSQMKTYYAGSFSIYKSEAGGAIKKFDKFIAEIKRLKENYPTCGDDGNRIERQ